MNEVNDDWYIAENWSNENITYLEDKNILYFNSNSKEEEAIITSPIPAEAKSFSFSFKMGNGYITHKIGYQDCGYATIGFGRNGNGDNIKISKGIRTNNVLNERNFVEYSIGTAKKPVGIKTDSDYFYFKINASNSGDDEMDVYFGDFELTFYEEEGYIPMSEYISFKENKTSETVFIDKHMTLPLLGDIALIVIFLADFLFKIFRRKEK